MATTRRDGKEKRGLSPPAVVKQVRSSSISPFNARQVEKETKSVPNYLKPTISSNPNPDGSSTSRKGVTTNQAVGSKRLGRIRSLEKPPAVTTHNNVKEKTTGKFLTGPPRPNLDKTAKIQRNGNNHTHIHTTPPTKGKGKVSPNNVAKKGPMSKAVVVSTTQHKLEPERKPEPDPKPEVVAPIAKESPELELNDESQQSLFESPNPDPTLNSTPQPKQESSPDTEPEESMDGKIENEVCKIEINDENQPVEEKNGIEEDMVKVESNAKEEKKIAKKENNDVIEETARKLVEKKKKGKVLAFAAAFETVISLQEPQTPQGHNHHQQQQQQQQQPTGEAEQSDSSGKIVEEMNYDETNQTKAAEASVANQNEQPVVDVNAANHDSNSS